MKVKNVVEFKTQAISGKWEIKSIKKGYAKLVIPKSDEELGLMIDLESLKKVEK